ncbi:MAG TPA: tetratricopeptide repeat protein [Amaricoccus sp.]|nr:tetratricopeptide repeat protein [Amaricoccus sp.]
MRPIPPCPRAALLAAPLLALALGLAACSSPEERAQAHYERALAYLAEGDTARARVEFRTVFRLDDDHAAARLAYAGMLRSTGDAEAALAQVELAARQHPASLEAQRATAELAFELQDLEAATRAADRAVALAPADPALRGLKASIDYRRDRNRPAAVAMARGVLAEDPANVAARVVLVADRLAAKDLAGARAEAEAGLAAAPGARELHLARVALLEEAGETAALGEALAGMAALYPDDPAVRDALVGWHLRSGDPAAAEAVLRAAADAPGAPPGAALALAGFLLETKGAGAARAELRARVDATGGMAAPVTGGPEALADSAAAADAAWPYARALAGLAYAEGDRAGGIAALRALLAATPASDARSDAGRDLAIDLARMLYDDPAGATRAASRAESAGLVAQVLAEDATHLGALKLDARAAIDADRPEAAIRTMRTGLTLAPGDPEVMTLMALAHERLGQRGLMGEQLARAVEASGRGREESLRYASFLMQERRPGPAEGVVRAALRRAPADPELLATLGRIRGTTAGPEARTRTRMETEADLDARIAADPDDLDARRRKADLAARAGRGAEAEALYRGVVVADPARPEAWAGLFALLAGEGRGGEAEAALADGIAATAGANGGEASSPLLFARAGVREAKGDLAGALADYETLYARSSADPVLANNLASLLLRQAGDAAGPGPDPATDPAVLERAWTIARRLQASDVPEFQDTLGWILHLRGDPAAAWALLEPAAAALPANAGVQIHAAEVARALGRPDAARAHDAAALAAAAAGSPLPGIEAVKARLAAPPEAPAPPGGG